MFSYSTYLSLGCSFLALAANAAPATLATRASFSGCKTITIAAQTVPAGKSLALTNLADGTTVQLAGDISFGTGVHWTGNLFTLQGGKIIFNGNGHTINGNGAYYWDGQGTNGGVDKPKYTVELKISGSFTNVKVINVPGHAFSVQNPSALTISSVTYDNSAGAKLGHNTDGFDVSHSTDLTITGCTVINQDDCIAINSGTNVVFSNNSCTGGHGISIGSIKTGNVVNGVTISNNKVINNQNGLRIKTYADNNNASVSNVIYKDNTVTGATSYGVIIVQDYTNSGETGTATPGITIKNVSFQGTNSVSTTSSATMVKVLCYPGDCTGTWNWSGLKTSGGKKGTNVGGAPITGYTF
ncbi:Endo-polygalacturonase Short=PG; AltName: Full=Pectinase; Flags: Precursor [Serendipita indica DSM 11827]|uniref:endo-polygalacturonase n=1 Tax=Serendipita indica (strain DSM 11827) TaxID=1109443 RepID=G4T688_SERID|nr:Endo-polygalacturonase Short=PG; AltName: Full=Pectinase; Flags: Precursor [Serendipita indica DSM 11827]CCA66860.1 related to endo-polygalacturonase [Serendipita indica DSM 11827]